jgi:hypothetical protein
MMNGNSPKDEDGPLGAIMNELVTSTPEESLPQLGPLPPVSQVLECQFSSWYSTFSSLKISGIKRTNVTFPSIIIDNLPDDFKEWLLIDGVRLPLDATNLSSCAPPETNNPTLSDDVWSSDDDDEGDSDSECSTPPKQFSFPQLNQQIQSAIKDLGGSVLPKLSWSAPKDATWLNGGSLKCQKPGDVYLLVKSSDFCLHDVLHALDDCRPEKDHDIPDPPPTQQLVLVLRKWCNLHPSMEFRCFVRQDELGTLNNNIIIMATCL